MAAQLQIDQRQRELVAEALLAFSRRVASYDRTGHPITEEGMTNLVPQNELVSEWRWHSSCHSSRQASRVHRRGDDNTKAAIWACRQPA